MAERPSTTEDMLHRTGSSSSRPLIGLFWFRHDLRLDDNPALNALATRVDQLVCVYVLDPALFDPGRFQAKAMGAPRWRFLLESLRDLQEQLERRGQRLELRWGHPVAQMAQAIEEHDAHFVGANHHPGPYERRDLKKLKELYPHCHWLCRHAHGLFTPERLPFERGKLPKQFTPFCKAVEGQLAFCPPEDAPLKLPERPQSVRMHWPTSLPEVEAKAVEPWCGGSQAGMAHWQQYLQPPYPVRHYKDTRNALEGEHSSSAMSAWLGNGSVSVRRLAQQLREHEKSLGQNPSTLWLYREWLWREYFQWHLYAHSAALFRFTGTRGKRPLTTFYAARLRAWQAGTTGLSLVDACMRQLQATGWLSNRGRQIAASALINELQLDWRYGAAWFEQQLLDFDVASNYGNWQYIAGVGVDPRGGRHFNLAHQERQYDPDGRYQARWLVDGVSSPVSDGVDMADWPIDDAEEQDLK